MTSFDPAATDADPRTDAEWEAWEAAAPIRAARITAIAATHGDPGHTYGVHCTRCVATAVRNGTIGDASPNYGDDAPIDYTRDYTLDRPED